jgi:uncharacterized protein (TIGR03085 family)
VTKFANAERAALADLMQQLGPEAPTLCEGWRTRDLAAHLVLRNNRLDAAPGIAIKALAGHTRRVQDAIAAQPWPALLARVRRRPWWAVLGEEAVNRTEYFVHHEDVRRAQPDWQPRELPDGLGRGLWQRVETQARLVLRKVPAAVTVTAPGYGSVTAGRGGEPVALSGDPGELMLFLTGRQAHARVDLTGPETITDRMRGSRYGI